MVPKETQAIVKEQLLVALSVEVEFKVARLICLLIAELAGTIDNLNEKWGELDGFIHKMVTDGSELQKNMGYLTMNYIFAYIQDRYETNGEELATLFESTLSKEPLSIRLSCVDALCHLITNIANRHMKPFLKLVTYIINILQELMSTNNEGKLKFVLEALTSVADNEPKYFAKNFDQMFQLLIDIAAKACQPENENFDDENIARLAVELLTTILERVPSLLKKKAPADYLVPLFKMIMIIMRAIPFEIDDDWIKPPPSFFLHEEGDEDNIVFGKRTIDRVLSCANEREKGLELNLIAPILMEYFSNETDWRYKNAALLAACNVGEYIDDPAKLSMIVPIMVSHMSHAHPRIRFAAAHCIGQISDNCDNQFPRMYHEQIMPAIFSGLSDPMSRVQRHVSASLCNFIDKTEKEIIDKYTTDLMIKLEYILKTAEPFVQEYVMSVIASISEATPENFKLNYYDQTMPFLIRVLQECKDYKYKKLRGHTIECITIIARAVGKEKFMNHAKTVIEALYQIQENELESQDPQKSFLLSAWQRLCIILKEDLVPYVELLVPSLLKLAASIPGISISTIKDSTIDLEEAAKELTSTNVPTEEEKRKMIHVTTVDIEEKEAAINMLSIMIEELSGHLDKYIERISEIVLHVLTRSGVESLREAAAGSLKSLIKGIKQAKTIPITPEYLSTMTKTFLSALLKSALDEYEPIPTQAEVEVMKEIIEETGKCLNKEEIIKLFEGAMRLMKESNDRKTTNKDVEYEEDVDEIEIEGMKDENKQENELQLEIAQLIGILFKTHPDDALCLVNLLYPNFLGLLLKCEADDHQHRLGLFIIIDMVEFFGYSRIPNLYPEFVNFILNYSQERETGVRQACLYGIGIIAVNAGDYYPKIAERCYNSLMEAINCELPPNTDKKLWKIAKDNGISSLGKTIKYQGRVFPDLNKIVKIWLDNMPLEKDIEEGKIQNEFLADMILNSTALIMGGNGENLEMVLDIIVDVVNTDQVNEEISIKLSKALNMLAGVHELKDRLAKYGADLEPEERKRLEDCVKLIQKA